MKGSLVQRIRTCAQGRTGRFLLTQLAHTAITVAVLAALLLGAARVGALEGVLSSAAATVSGSSLTTVNYQGRLADASGNPIDNTNPGVGMSFILYAQETGGSPVWTETHANVPVSEGLFSVRLGSINPLSTGLLTGDRWLGIQVGTDPEMTPREKLAAVPYAIHALTVPDGSITTEKIADGAVTQAKAPFLVESGNGDNYEIYVGHAQVSSTSTDGFNEAYIPFGRTFSEVLAFIPINHNVYAHGGFVIGVRSISGSGGWVRFSEPAGTLTYSVKYIVIGR